jgi:uncharacterized protein
MSLIKYLFTLVFIFSTLQAQAGAELDVNTPGVQAIKLRMQARHGQLAAYYTSGAVGLSMDGTISLRDEASVPLAARRPLSTLVEAENTDRESLYAEIANANGHPEWHNEIRRVFAPRWLNFAQRGWWMMSDHGWIQK